MEVLGYILGGLFIACLVGITAFNVYKLVKAIKARKEMKKESSQEIEKEGDN